MKTWLSLFLPNDEYKERQMLIFLAEAAVLQIMIVIGLIATDHFFITIPTNLILFICLFSIILYVLARYIFSGIEYTDVCTETQYKQQLKALRIKSFGFVVIYFIVAVIFTLTGLVTFFDSRENIFDLFIILAIGGPLVFIIEFISLKKSYNKNKELL